MDTEAVDRSLRRYVYQHFIRHGRAPLVKETAAALSVPMRQVGAALKRLAQTSGALHGLSTNHTPA
jgi:hypothetical protein